MKICTIDGCEKKVHAKGLCQMHYRRELIKHTSVCVVERCNKNSISKKMCSMHYQRFLKYGDPDYTYFREECSVPGCERGHQKHGYCTLHAPRVQRHGNPHIKLVGNYTEEEKKLAKMAQDKAKEFYRGQKFECTIHGCNNKKVELHHTDYSVPLNVVPLCQKHHRKLHMVLRRSKFKEAI